MDQNGEAPSTIAALVDGRAERQPDAVALIAGEHAISYGELAGLSARLAAGFRALGIRHGDRVAIWLPNTPWWLAAFTALTRLGAIAVCVNTRFRSAEVGDIVKRSGASCLIYQPGFRGIDFDGILAGIGSETLSGLASIVTCDGSASRMEGLPDAVAIGDLTAEAPFEATATPDDPAVLFTTSGTTSAPKFVLHGQRSLSRHARQVATAFGYDHAGTCLLQALPLCGTFGLAQALAALAAGAPSVLSPSFDAAEARDLIARHRVTGFNGTDEMFARLCDGAAGNTFDSIVWCGFASFSGADPVDFATRCEARGLNLVGLYGMSEVQALFARQPLDLEVNERALAGGALPRPQATARVVDPETGRDVGPGASGELLLSGPSLFSEYFGNPQATAAAFDPEGYVHTGDLGHLTDDGRFIFEARMGDSLRLGGFLVNPAEIDAWLERAMGVAAAQTVGIEIDGRMRPVSFVTADKTEASDEDDLIAHCRSGLAGFKVPSRIFTLDAFPTTDGPNGRKIQRSALRDLARERCTEY